ncbi:ribosome biogenesis GTPase Der [Aeromonas hydrophila]|uniref:ribosome biogenesis GTPase Der n=1 Tax=Aeromonas hydrophila TaxID=644 RepID=UPI003F7A66AB
MTPVVALVGRPNVGKSTLFNRLTRTRDALVADFPGLTRDRKYGQAKLGELEFIVVDTGGIDGTEEGIELKMAEQSLLAIEEADVVLFMVDARAGLTAADQAIAEHLRKAHKKVFLVANKTDGIDGDSAGLRVLRSGAGRGLPDRGRPRSWRAEPAGTGPGSPSGTLVDAATDEDAQDEEEEDFDEEALLRMVAAGELDTKEDTKETPFADLPIKFAIVGRPNVGKSTLTNRMLGEDRVIVYDMPGTTRDSVYIPMERDEQKYVVIDTAGVRRRGKVHETVEKFSVIKTLKAIEDANVCLLVIDAQETITDQDLSILGYVLHSGRSVVLVVNKWDGLDQKVKEDVKNELDRRLGFIDFARVHFISALHGSGVGHLFESIQEAYQSATRRTSTAMLTRIMQMAQEDHQPPMVNGRRVKLKYAHAGGYNPPRIVIHGNQLNDLPDSYKRYLINYFRKSLKIMGSPIRVEFQESVNPFEGKKNTMTLSQERQRKRLLKMKKK